MTDGDLKFEEFVRREGQSYNAPSAEVPRDQMWAEIQRQRRTAMRRDRLHAGTRVSVNRWWIGMAATLLVGVAIGRFALGTSRDAVTAADAAAPAPGAPVASVAAAPGTDGDAGVAYRVATNGHLVRAEALLTAFRASPADAAVDTQMTAWARDVLSNTRLLLDSPVPMDPARKLLLRDLEAVLMQLAHPSPVPGQAGASEDRRLVNRNLERTQMLSRLRSQLPLERHSGT